SYNIMVGNDDNKFNPTKTLTRAENGDYNHKFIR
ncbi:S-layer homology domain-containing protein, partial [Firmicutes bacterium AF36-3BH]